MSSPCPLPHSPLSFSFALHSLSHTSDLPLRPFSIPVSLPLAPATVLSSILPSIYRALVLSLNHPPLSSSFALHSLSLTSDHPLRPFSLACSLLHSLYRASLLPPLYLTPSSPSVLLPFLALSLSAAPLRPLLVALHGPSKPSRLYCNNVDVRIKRCNVWAVLTSCRVWRWWW